MKITIACVGKIKEKYFVNAIEEYSKRLSRYVTLNIAEVPAPAWDAPGVPPATGQAGAACPSRRPCAGR